MKTWLVCILVALSPFLLEGVITIRNGKVVTADYVATLPVEEHFNLGIAAYNQEDFEEAIHQFGIVAYCYPHSKYAPDAKLYKGISYFYHGDYEFANQEISCYIKDESHPERIEQAIEYKFLCAEAFRCGKGKRHVMGWEQMPRLLDGSALAIEIYDEIITSFPCHPYAAEALYAKACLYWREWRYRESVETFQTLIRRFPQHELAPESYVAISYLYHDQAEKEYQNPDLRALAELNYKKFMRDFPNEERAQEAEGKVFLVREINAQGMWETGQFYERKGKPEAAILYYRNALKDYPDAKIAEACRHRLEQLCATS